MRVKMRDVKTGSAQEFTYKTNDMVEVAEVEKKEMQFLYRDGDNVIFMDPKNFEQAEVPAELLDEQAKFLMPDLKCWVLWYEEKPIGVSLPPNVVMMVTEAPESTAGNRVNAPKKLIKLENGVEVQAPIFIKEGERVIVDTATGEYVSRAN
jgi:elongation factor P